MATTPVLTATLTSPQELPSSLHDLCHAIKRIQSGLNTIPMQVADQVRASLGFMDPNFTESWLADTTDRQGDVSFLKGELSHLKEIAAASQECYTCGAHEPVWNEEVDSQLLKVALAPFRGRLRHRNVTTVDLLPEYVPYVGGGAASLSVAEEGSSITDSSQAGATTTIITSTLQTKRVDYVIALDDADVRKAALVLLRTHVASDPTAVAAVNHVDNAFLNYRPIAVSIETKTPEGGEMMGRSQLSTWGWGHVMRLRALAGGGDNVALPSEQLALPLVLVVGSRWTVHFLVDQGETLVSLMRPGTGAGWKRC